MTEPQSNIEGGRVLIAKIPAKEVNPSELQDLVDKVPGAEIEAETTDVNESAFVKVYRNFIKIGKK
jgi:hypothetical protein